MTIIRKIIAWFKRLFANPSPQPTAQAIEPDEVIAPPAPRGLRLIKICPGRRHAWYDSHWGIIRKPIQ